MNENGDILISKSGSKSEVRFEAEEGKFFEGNIMTHNHPSNTAFSREDMLMLTYRKLKEIRAVSTSYTHSLKFKGKYNGEDDPITKDTQGRRMLVKDYCEIKNEELRNTIIPQIEAGTLSIEDANKIHYHLLWSGISKENPDFIYERRDV